MSTSVGNLFVNVRARTQGFSKALGNVRRRLRTFATSGMGLLAGMGAAFLTWRTGVTIFANMLARSKEMRTAWAGVKNTINEMIQEFVDRFGPSIAKGLNDFKGWMSSSDYVREVFDGMVLGIELIITGVKGLIKWLDAAVERYTKIFDFLAGTTGKREKLGKGLTMEQLVELRGGSQPPAAAAAAPDPNELYPEAPWRKWTKEQTKIRKNTGMTAKAGTIQ